MPDKYDVHDNYDMDDESVIHERIDHLKDKGYRGFSVVKDISKWNRWEVTTKDSSAIELKASGETREEAYKKMVDMIDYTLDDTQ